MSPVELRDFQHAMLWMTETEWRAWLSHATRRTNIRRVVGPRR